MTRDDVRATLRVHSEERLLALLPGSRPQEVGAILPVLAGGAILLRSRKPVHVVVSRAPSIPEIAYTGAREKGLVLWDGSAGDLAGAADAALVASGTATLETGLRGTPLGVVYRTGAVNWHLARALIKIRTIGLVNIAAGGHRVPELLQGNLTPENVALLAEKLLFDPVEAGEQRAYLSGLAARLGGSGAAARAAEAVLEAVLERSNAG